MAASKSGPKVVGIVDETNGVVTIGVVVGKAFLPVASASLDYAKARGLDASGEPEETDDNGSEG